MSGRSEQACTVLVDSARRLDELGHPAKAASHRVQQAMILRRLGRVADAREALPAPDQAEGHTRVAFLKERGEVQLESGQVDSAIADFDGALRIERECYEADDITTAGFEESIADALFEAGRLEESEALTRKVLGVFAAVNHPNGAGALVTMALIEFTRGAEEEAEDRLEQAIRLIGEAPLIEIANRARGLEAAGRRLERHGLARHALAFRVKAETCWTQLPGATDAVTVPAAIPCG